LEYNSEKNTENINEKQNLTLWMKVGLTAASIAANNAGFGGFLEKVSN
jgi:hypothetical protein